MCIKLVKTDIGAWIFVLNSDIKTAAWSAANDGPKHDKNRPSICKAASELAATAHLMVETVALVIKMFISRPHIHSRVSAKNEIIQILLLNKSTIFFYFNVFYGVMQLDNRHPERNSNWKVPETPKWRHSFWHLKPAQNSYLLSFMWTDPFNQCKNWSPLVKHGDGANNTDIGGCWSGIFQPYHCGRWSQDHYWSTCGVSSCELFGPWHYRAWYFWFWH